jgi:UbiD family decarboxylase
MGLKGFMTLRGYIQNLDTKGQLVSIDEPISKKHEIAAVLKTLEPKTVQFNHLKESDFKVIGNLFCNKQQFADYFGIQPQEIIPLINQAIKNPLPVEKLISEQAPCQEIVHQEPDLNHLPIPTHFFGDGGPYITAGVVIAGHPTYGQNMDFHRCMQFSPKQMAVRVVKGRHFHHFLEDLGQVDIAICVGNSPDILAAAATSVDLGFDESKIAAAINQLTGNSPPSFTHAHSVDLMIPAFAEFVIEGTVYRDLKHAEGPFVDLTETQDVIRQQPVLEIKTITHRKDAIWQALLPGSLEHKLLMGMPREPTIFEAVNQVVKCLDVHVNPGGCSWLHAIVQIKKISEQDGKNAISAAFTGHRSCKHVFIVDEDIDIYDPLQVEWAMATRFQGDRDMVLLEKEAGSSLDPSAQPGTKMTTKIGFDLTAPIGKDRMNFQKVPYPDIDLDRFFK